MNMLKRTRRFAAIFLFPLIAFSTFVTAPAGAVIVAPGAVETVPATNFAANPNLGGVVQNDNLLPFTITEGPGGAVIASGNLQNRVVRSNNLGTLVFGPLLRDLTIADGAEITGLRLEGYGASVLDIGYRTDGALTQSLGPDTVSRSVDGSTLTFRYDPGVTPGVEPYFLSILSDAFAFSLGGIATIFAKNSNGETFSAIIEGLAIPQAEVPLPAAAPLFLAALAGLGFSSRRKRLAA